MAKKTKTGFNVGHVRVDGVCDITLEISNDEVFAQRIKEINAELRFKHKIQKPQWDIRRVGEGSPTYIPKSATNGRKADT